VEYEDLKNLATISRGVRVVRSQLTEKGEFPVYQNSLTPMGFFEESNCTANSAFIISAGAAGDIGFCTVDFWAADDCFFFTDHERLHNKFLFYSILCQQKFLYSQVRRASVPRLARTVVEQLRIPVPPLPVQEEIVSILDRFEALVSDLKSGLPAEIALRRKQYETYRDQLLTFQPLP
jgi:restriction endonuclease S subunit